MCSKYVITIETERLVDRYSYNMFFVSDPESRIL